LTRNIMRLLNKCFVITTLVIFLGGLSTITPPLASAHSINKPSSQHNLVSTAVRPYCSGSVSITPSSEALRRGQTALFTVYWSCQGNVYVIVAANWGDGGTSSYTCWANCSSGSQDMHHTYNSAATYGITMTMAGNASGQAFANAKVS
jgi:hypothetical protein